MLVLMLVSRLVLVLVSILALALGLGQDVRIQGSGLVDHDLAFRGE